MKIRCIDNKDCEGNLKLGKIFEPLKEDENKYTIQLGNGTKGTYLKSRFEEVR